MRQVFEPRGPTTSRLGIVDPAAARAGFALTRSEPAHDLTDLVERHWIIRWGLPPGESFTQVVVPHPTANVVAEAGRFAAHGIPEGVFERTLSGSGVVVGTKLRPGAFRVLLGRPDAVRRGVVVPASAFLGPLADDAGREAVELAARGDDDGAVAAVTGLLRDRAHAVRTGRTARDLDVVAAAFGALVSGGVSPGEGVGALAAAAGTSTRSLQRLFARYVGVTPKWVLQRHRVHLAADLLAVHPGRPLADVAADVGYYDQAHFSTDFQRATGTTPAAYARRCERSAAALLAAARA
jgi:AraC-like DNA-binding protein